MVFYYDMREQEICSWDMFLQSFEHMIIKTLVERNKHMLLTKKVPLISE